MSLQRNVFRVSQRASQRLRNGLVRSLIQRRFNSNHPMAGLPSWAQDNEFNRERANVKRQAAITSDLWRKITFYVVIPCLALGALNAYNLWEEHWDHWDHMPPLEDRVEYAYQNIRSKNYPWGDGDKSLFWNLKTNYHKKDKAT